MREKGITNKKYYDENAKVDFEYITSRQYRDKFLKLTNNQKVNNKLYEIAKAILIHRNGSFLEDLYCVDSNSGKIVVKQVHSTIPNEVKYKKEMNDEILSYEPNILISIHNHGTNIQTTGSDFVSCGYRNYKFGLVVCHNGDVYFYKTSKTMITRSLIDKRVEKHIEKRYNLSIVDAHLLALSELKEEYEIDWRKL